MVNRLKQGSENNWEPETTNHYRYYTTDQYKITLL